MSIQRKSKIRSRRENKWRRRNLKKKWPGPLFWLRHEVWHKPRSIVVSGGNREKSAEHSMTKRNKMISNLSESYGKQENDNDFYWSARKALDLGMSILLHLQLMQEWSTLYLDCTYVHTRTYTERCS